MVIALRTHYSLAHATRYAHHVHARHQGEALRACALARYACACAAISFFVLLSFFGRHFAPLATPEQNENIRGSLGRFQKNMKVTS